MQYPSAKLIWIRLASRGQCPWAHIPSKESSLFQRNQAFFPRTHYSHGLVWAIHLIWNHCHLRALATERRGNHGNSNYNSHSPYYMLYLYSFLVLVNDIPSFHLSQEPWSHSHFLSFLHPTFNLTKSC